MDRNVLCLRLGYIYIGFNRLAAPALGHRKSQAHIRNPLTPVRINTKYSANVQSNCIMDDAGRCIAEIPEDGKTNKMS
jgi:hypothetical protein